MFEKPEVSICYENFKKWLDTPSAHAGRNRVRRIHRHAGSRHAGSGLAELRTVFRTGGTGCPVAGTAGSDLRADDPDHGRQYYRNHACDIYIQSRNLKNHEKSDKRHTWSLKNQKFSAGTVHRRI